MQLLDGGILGKTGTVEFACIRWEGSSFLEPKWLEPKWLEPKWLRGGFLFLFFFVWNSLGHASDGLSKRKAPGHGRERTIPQLLCVCRAGGDARVGRTPL